MWLALQLLESWKGAKGIPTKGIGEKILKVMSFRVFFREFQVIFQGVSGYFQGVFWFFFPMPFPGVVSGPFQENFLSI